MAQGTNNLLWLGYSYDLVGNITQIADSMAGQTQSFGYDSLYRLTSASATAAGNDGGYSETYQYDSYGWLQPSSLPRQRYGRSAPVALQQSRILYIRATIIDRSR